MPPASSSRPLGVLLLFLALAAAPAWSASLRPESPGTEAALADPGLCARVDCPDLPLVVDEQGDTITGDLGVEGSLDMGGDVRFQGTSGVLFPSGRLSGDSVPNFNGQRLCLAGQGVPGCGVLGVVGTDGVVATTSSSVASVRADWTRAQQRVLGACPAGQSIRAIAQDGSVACEADDGATYTATMPLLVAGTTLSLSASGCVAGDVWKWFGSLWACEPDLVGTGDVTSVTAGSGLVGGGTAGDVSLAIGTGAVTGGHLLNGTVSAADVDRAQVQLRVTGTCAAGMVIASITDAGGVTCRADGPVTKSALSTADVGLPPNTCANLLSVTLTAPSAGRIVVEGEALAVLNHAQGIPDWFSMAINASATSCGNNGATEWSVPDGIPAFTQVASNVAFRWAFDVAAGTHTYHLNAHMRSGANADGSDVVKQSFLQATWTPA